MEPSAPPSADPTKLPLAPLQAAVLTAIPGIRHGFYTRAGGVSDGIYRGLNCGLGSADDPACVLENRARVARHLGAADTRVLTLHQCHSAAAYVVSEHIPREHLPQADGLATNKPGLVIGVLAADCCPVLFADAEAGVIGAAHAGWRGALSGVLKATVAAMEGLGARRERIVAALGPVISQPNYEVGADFVDQLLGHDPANARFLVKSHLGKSRFDLPGYVKMRLHGLHLKAIDGEPPCTYADEERFFSYRRATHRKEPDYGRQISAIVLI